jgi:RNA polymerase sigma-70 factor (family 1)
MAQAIFLPEELFRRYYTRLCNFAFQLLEEKDMAEDIVQDAFLAFWNTPSKISDDPVAIKNYLYSSVRNACYNHYRKSKIQERYFQIHNNDELEEPQALQAMIRAEVMDEIYKAVKTLPGSCQQIFRMGYLEGLSNPKIAERNTWHQYQHGENTEATGY